MMINPLVSVILGSYNRLPFLKSAIESVRRNGITIPYEIIVIDGGSSDGSAKWLVQQKDVVTIIQHNHGEWNNRPLEKRSWGYYMNIAFRSAHGKYLLMMSDDSLLVPGAAMNGFGKFERLLTEGQKIGALAFYWRNTPEIKKYSVMKFFERTFVNHGLYLRSALEEIGWVDEINYKFYCADVDICLRMDQAGYQTLSCPESIVEHYALHGEDARKNNTAISQANNDLGHLMLRWCKVYNYPENADPEKLVSFDYLDYSDPYLTVKKFPRIYRFIKPWEIKDKIFKKITRLLRETTEDLSVNNH